MQKDEKRRFDYIDAAKGIGIFLVVVGHTLSNGAFDLIPIVHKSLSHFIYSFHMPFFYMISGFLSNGKYAQWKGIKDVRDWFLKLCRSYFIPYLMMMCLCDGISLQKIKDYLLPRQSTLLHYSPLASWWLPNLILVLLVIRLLHIICLQFGKIGEYGFHIACLLLMLAGLHYSLPLGYTNIYYYANVALVGIGFYDIGIMVRYMFNRLELHECHVLRAILIAAVCFAAVYVLGYSNDKVYMVLASYGNPVLFVLTGISGALMVIFAGVGFTSVPFVRFGIPCP